MDQFGVQDVGDIAALPLFMLVMMLYGLLTNAFSRWREVRADHYALETTRNDPAFASAMTRLANQNLAEVDPKAGREKERFIMEQFIKLESAVFAGESQAGCPIARLPFSIIIHGIELPDPEALRPGASAQATALDRWLTLIHC